MAKLQNGYTDDDLLDIENVRKSNANYQEIYQIVIRKKHGQEGVEFREPNSPAFIKVVRLSTRRI